MQRKQFENTSDYAVRKLPRRGQGNVAWDFNPKKGWYWVTRPGEALLYVTAFGTEPGIKIPGYVNQVLRYYPNGANKEVSFHVP